MKLRIVSLAFAAALAAPTAFAQTTLVINSFGGSYEKIHRDLVIDSFEKMHNVKVQVITAYSADALTQLRAQKARPQYDVIHFSGGQEAVAAAEGLLAPIKPEQLTNYKDLYPFAVAGLSKGQGVVYSVAALGILYHADKVKTPPTGWKDLHNPAFRGHIMLTDLSNTYGLFGLLMLNQVHGGTLDNIQPGLNKVLEILPYATIIKNSPEIQQGFAQSDVWIAPFAQDYAFTLRKAGLPVKFVQAAEGTPASFITINAVAGRPNTELAIKFIDHTVRAEAQAGWARELRYTPVNRAAKLADDVAQDVIHGEAAISKLVSFDPIKIGEKRAQWLDAWNKAIAK